MKSNWRVATRLRWLPPAFSLLLAAAAHGLPPSSRISVTDDRGQVIELADSPRRIVTLLPSLTESVCALGECTRLVGTDRYSNWPTAVRALPKLGGLDDAQIEEIATLRPDVVLAARSTRAIDRLEELGMRVMVLDVASLEDVRRALDTLARLLGTPQAGVRLWRGLESHIAGIAAALPSAFRGGRVYFEVDESPYAAGAASFIGQLFTRLGLGNVVPVGMGPFPQLNPEFVVLAQPDLIMGSQREVDGMAARPGWSVLAALRTGRTCRFSDAEMDVLVRPGPRLGEASDLIVACLKRLALQRSG